jgi:TPR repeat protein
MKVNATKVRRSFLLAAFLTVSSAGLRADDFNVAALQAAADKGDARAQYQLATCYAKGKGVAAIPVMAASYMRKAADQGYVEAQTDLGSYYGRGFGLPRDLTNAVQWYRKAAAQGDALAQYCLGACLLKGSGVTRDVAAGVKCWRQAAEGGLPESQYSLGLFLMNRGFVVDTNYVNYPEAAKWLQKAADQDYVPAMNNLGFLYQRGLGVPQNPATALKWYRLGAEHEDPRAQANLGLMYENGSGIPVDPVQACMWYLLSSEKHDEIGRHQLSDLNLHRALTTNQMAQAQQLAEQFRASHRKAQDPAVN